MRTLVLLSYLSFGCVSLLKAQGPTVASARVGLSVAADEWPSRFPPPRTPDSCPGTRSVTWVAETVGGAAAGWLVFLLTIGVLADDHGAEYRRVRRPFLVGGAVLGAAHGTYRIVKQSCDELRRRR